MKVDEYEYIYILKKKTKTKQNKTNQNKKRITSNIVIIDYISVFDILSIR